MQQPVNLLKSAARLFIVLTPLMTSACAPAWVGSWRGTADLGPVEAQSARLTLQHKPMGGSGSWRRADGAEVNYTVCAIRHSGQSLEVDLVAAPKRCSEGPLLTLRGEVGARVLHGRLVQNKKDVGFYRLWPASTWPDG